MSTHLARALALGLLVPVVGCDNTFIAVNTDGLIVVAVSTSGVGTDRDGFAVSVDGGTQQLVAAGGSVTLTGLSTGSHSVRLSGLADNCKVEGPNPRTVVVRSDGTANVSFQVRCSLAAT